MLRFRRFVLGQHQWLVEAEEASKLGVGLPVSWEQFISARRHVMYDS